MARTRSIRQILAVATTIVVLLVSSVIVSAPASSTGPGLPSVVGSEAPSTGPVALVASSSSGSIVVAPALHLTAGISLVAPLPPTVPLSVVVGLASPDPTGLTGLLSALYTPSSPQYRQFWTPERLASEFGASPSSIASATRYFDSFGLSTRVSPDHLEVDVEGASSEVAAAFGTSFEQFRSADGSMFVSHLSSATLPAVAPWSGAYGLGNQTPITPAISGVSRWLSPIAPSATCSGVRAVLTPCQLWQAYGTSGFIGSGVNGSGYSIAVVDPYSSSETQPQLQSDLTQFAATTGVPVGTVNFDYPVPTTTNLNVSSNPAWSDEDALDLEWARAMAPGAAVSMVYSPNAGAGLYEAIDWVVANRVVNVLSLSWGEPDVGIYNAYNTPCSSECNASTDGSYGLLSPVLQFAAAEGISVFAASGDCGAADGTSGVSTNYPASDPAVTGVGGTVLSVNSTGTYLSEVAWGGNASGAQSPGCQNQGGSGGGYSPFPRPWWQNSLTLGPARRGVPDVAADAATPALVVLGGVDIEVGGTSLSTPIWAGLTALADQNAARPLGFLAPALYSIYASANYSRDFHDILSGSNGYSAGAGWDPVTGLGSPNGTGLIPELARSPTVPLSSLATFVYGTPRFGPAPLSVTFHVNATGGSGIYPLEGVSFGDGNASFAPSGAASHTFETPGVYTVQSYVGDSTGNFSVSPPIAVVVGGGHALNVSLTASTTSPGVDTAVTFTAHATGGVSPYVYNFTFGDGTFLLGSTAPAVAHAFGVAGGFCVAVVVADSALPVDGSASARLAVRVGGGAAPACSNDTTPLTVSPASGIGVRDAPADFPVLFSTSGGSTSAGTLPPTFQYRSSDPYVGACDCAIFRSPGTFEVTGYANDSENQQAVGASNVTVAPPLVGNFTASTMFGPAPLHVTFRASSSGGFRAAASNTTWTFPNGTVLAGASVSAVFSLPGPYLVVAHLSDSGHGNASKAFVIDVGGSSSSSVPYLSLTVDPAVDVPLGATVVGSAQENSPSGAAAPSVFRWNIDNRSGAYGSTFNWTASEPPSGTGNRTITVGLAAFGLSNGSVRNEAITLSGFPASEAGGFRPRTDALVLTDTAGPTLGAAPYAWNGTSSATGPGSLSFDWSATGVAPVAGPDFQNTFGAGEYTVAAVARDSYGDSAVDPHALTVTGPLNLNASLSSLSGVAPFALSFAASASGGVGPPYRFVWTTGSSQFTGANGTITFGSPGSYQLTLRANDTSGDQLEKVFDIQVDPAAASYLPYVFVIAGAGVGAAAALVAAFARRRRPRAPGAPPEGATL